MEGREHGIRVNSISPGLMESNATRDSSRPRSGASAMLGKTFVGSPRPARGSRERRTVPGLGREFLRDGRRHRGRWRDEGLVKTPAAIGWARDETTEDRMVQVAERLRPYGTLDVSCLFASE